MSSNRDLDQILDRALAEIREETPDAATEQASSSRVREHLHRELEAQAQNRTESHPIRDCSDFQALIPAHLRGGLTEAKQLLLQDHLSECVPCRRALKEARQAQRKPSTAPAVRRSSPAAVWTWRLAAAAVILIAFVGLSVKTDVFTLQTGGWIQIEAVDGELFKVAANGPVPVQAGERVSFSDTKLLRTGKDSTAMLRLADDSAVEMSARAELTVFEQRKLWNRGQGDSVIDLGRGSVIVEASDQGSGHLYVDTPDARVAVTGTVFAVNHGIKGSRVSVLEGEVQVAHSGDRDVLRPGQQATTGRGLGRVPIEREIAWSKQLDKHLALIEQFAALGREIDARITGPGQRYDTGLLDRAPEGTTVYVAIPNFSATLAQAYDLMQEKISDNDLLQSWWDESVVASGADENIATAMEKIRAYGRQLDEEIVVTVGGMQQERSMEDPEVLIYAKTVDSAALREMLEADIAELRAQVDGDQARGLVLLDDPWAAAPEGDLFLWVGDAFLAVAPRIASIRSFAGTAEGGGASAFYGGAFHSRLADLYSDGVEWVIGVDVETMKAGGMSADDPEATRQLEALGILDVQHIIAQREEYDDYAESRAVLTFDQPRRGVASWLAEPAPMGSLQFISPNAYFAAGFVMKEPVQVVDELIEFLGRTDDGFSQGLEEFEQQHSIDIREDIAAAIGGEFAFALDGPVLPKPSWKLVMEVYDTERLQGTLQWATSKINDWMHDNGRRGFEIEQSRRAGRTFFELKSLDTGISAHYVFVDGYMIASASRPLLDRALQFRKNGLSIVSNPDFIALLPRDAQVNFSGVLFQDWGSVVGGLAERIRQGAASAGGDEAFLGHLGALTGPNLTLAYGESSRITLVNTSEGSLIGRGLTSMLSLQSLLSVQELLGEAVQEDTGGPSHGSDPPRSRGVNEG